MTARTDHTSTFLAGTVCMGSALSLHQDFLAPQGYIAHVEAYWLTGWITVPLAIIGLLWSFLHLRAARREPTPSTEDADGNY